MVSNKISASIIALGVTISTPSAIAQVAVGVYEPSGIAGFETTLHNAGWTGSTLALDYIYEKWTLSNLSQESNDITNGRTPVIAWAEDSADMPAAQDIISGYWNSKLSADAYNLNALGGTVIIAFIPEMQNPDHLNLGTIFYGNQYWYQTTSGISNAGQMYQAAAQQVYNTIHPLAPNVRFVFAPENGAYLTTVGSQMEWTYFYPGNSYVQYVGSDHRFTMDNFDNTPFVHFYNQASTTGLPIFMNQVCPNDTTNGPGAYINSAMDSVHGARAYPNVVAFIYNDNASGGCPLKVPPYYDAIGHFANLANDTYFQKRVPSGHPRHKAIRH